MLDSERQIPISYLWLMLTFALSRTVSELYAILVICMNRKWRNADFSARWRHKSNLMSDSERQLWLMLTFALSRTVSELYAIFYLFCIPEMT